MSLPALRGKRALQSYISPSQCRAARAATGLQQTEVADAAGVSRPTVAEFERGERVPYPNNLKAIRAAFEALGVVFLEAEGGQEGILFPARDGPAATS
jgi:transcriptional regulator with XRE-family HTH domain